MKNKKAQDTLNSAVIFVLLNVAFIGILGLAIIMFGTGADSLEKIYGQKIVMVTDSMVEGSVLEIDLKEIYNVAKKNNFEDNIILVDKENNNFTIKTSSSSGHTYHFFSDITGTSFLLNPQENSLIIKT
jgi:hypothetical protein